MDYLTVQGIMKLWYAVFWASAWGFAVGALLFMVDFFRRRKGEALSSLSGPAPAVEPETCHPHISVFQRCLTPRRA